MGFMDVVAVLYYSVEFIYFGLARKGEGDWEVSEEDSELEELGFGCGIVVRLEEGGRDT